MTKSIKEKTQDNELQVGVKYEPRTYMQAAIDEMLYSISDHMDRTDPKVGAVLVSPDGKFMGSAHRGEYRKGDHAEFTLLEKKFRGEDLTRCIIYTTLEPCVERNQPKSACYKRIINARISKVYIGLQDPHHTVNGKGKQLLESENIEIDFFDADLAERISEENKLFISEAENLTNIVRKAEIIPAVDTFRKILFNHTLKDFSQVAMNELIEKAKLDFEIDSNDFNKYLLEAQLISVDRNKIANPTGLGLMLLGKNPQPMFSQSSIYLTVFQDNADSTMEEFDGPLLLIPKKIKDFLEISFPTYISRANIEREEYSKIPITAIREVIFNAIAHRDYSLLGAHIQIYIHKDRVEVFSPGIPEQPIEKFKNFNVTPYSRNYIIALLLKKMRYVEERGFGMKELANLSSQGFLRPTFRIQDSNFVTVVYTDKEAIIIPEGFEEKFSILSDTLKRGYRLFINNEKLSSTEYSRLMNIPSKTGRNQIKKLVDGGLIEPEGEGPARVYRAKT